MITVVGTYVRRLGGALALNPTAYEDVEADGAATTQACITVLLASVAAAIGAGRSASMITVAAVALLGWASWALLTFEVGARLLPGARTHANVGELLRTIGFAAAPGLFLAFGAIPGAAAPVFAIVSLWMLAAMVVAVRQALDYTSTARAIAVCVTGWALTIAIVLGVGFFAGVRVS
jgi:hypothetical protein